MIVGVMASILRVAGIVGLAATVAAAQSPRAATDPQEVFDQSIKDFLAGNIEKSSAGFDAFVALVPDSEPQLWQRGIVLYYAGRYDDCRKQFELHRTVNPNDVENAAWHFLCVARADTTARARAALLPVGPDSRVPMEQVYGLLVGSHTTDDVLAAAGGQPRAEFYAHLYLGLHAEALGNQSEALEHIRIAAVDENARIGGYMHTVAKVHLSLRDLDR